MITFAQFNQQRIGPKIVGGFLGLVAAGYVVYVGADGGVINQQRPMMEDHIDEKLSAYVVDVQNPEQIVSEAKASGDPEIRAVSRHLLGQVSKRLAIHREIAGGKRPVPKGQSADLAALFSKHVTSFPEECRVSIDGITPRTTLYKPGQWLELLCSSPTDAETIFNAYINKMVEKKWLVALPEYDVEAGRGVAVAERDGWKIFICVTKGEVFKGSPTCVYWYLVSEEAMFFDEDEEE